MGKNSRKNRARNGNSNAVVSAPDRQQLLTNDDSEEMPTASSSLPNKNQQNGKDKTSRNHAKSDLVLQIDANTGLSPVDGHRQQQGVNGNPGDADYLPSVGKQSPSRQVQQFSYSPISATESVLPNKTQNVESNGEDGREVGKEKLYGEGENCGGTVPGASPAMPSQIVKRISTLDESLESFLQSGGQQQHLQEEQKTFSNDNGREHGLLANITNSNTVTTGTPPQVYGGRDASHSSYHATAATHLSIGEHRLHTTQIDIEPQCSSNYNNYSNNSSSERTPLLSKQSKPNKSTKQSKRGVTRNYQQSDDSEFLIQETEEEDMTSSASSAGNGTPEKTGSLQKRPNSSGSEDSEMLPCGEGNLFIYVITVLSAIGGFLFGYDTGIVSGAMVFIRDHFHLDEIWQEVIVSATILAAWIFSILAGSITNRMGRKFVILLASGVFTVGAFLMAFSPDKYFLLIGRFTVGVAIGLASMVIPVYIAEVAPVGIRGRLVTINTCCITFGQFVASIIAGLFSHNTETGWRWMLGLAAVPSIIQMVFFFFMPESPRWLIQKGRYQEALEGLSKCRSGSTQSPHVLAEFDIIKSNASDREEENVKSAMDVLRSSPVRKAVFIGCLLMMYQQLAGINTVMYYSATIIQMSGVTNKSTAVWLSAVTSFINFICSFIGMASVEKFGRRKLVLLSMLGVILALSVLGIGFLLASVHAPGVNFPGESSDSPCSGFTGCSQCVHSSQCGFCFEEASSHVSGQFAWAGTPTVNGTCVSIDPNNSEYANATTTFCREGTSGDWIWATMWCPSNYSWLILLGLVSYLFFFAPGMGAMPWTINSEIYPIWARSFCCAASTSTNWFFNLIVSFTFLSLTNALTAQGAYFFYSGVAISGFVLFYFFLPETKGRSLEEIESIFEQPLCQMRKVKPMNCESRYDNNNDSNRNSTGSVNNSDKAIYVSPRHC